ncbi:hypothetical protein NL676_020753 [Syzygium grande]|nr:hypothetical protein NL676_020753 [Syzygium grande]
MCVFVRLFSSFAFVKKEVKKKLLPKKMAAASNATLNHQNHCTICLDSLAVCTTMTSHPSLPPTFHLDCLGSAFNAGNGAPCAGQWRKGSGGASRPQLLGAAERVSI